MSKPKPQVGDIWLFRRIGSDRHYLILYENEKNYEAIRLDTGKRCTLGMDRLDPHLACWELVA